MNPRNGLKISAFKNAAQQRNSDKELVILSTYLLAINKLSNDFSSIDHSNWKEAAIRMERSFSSSS
jgi:hypothetical protein